ncbi:P-loop containing nucleoside triphosphate hydrolase protein [Pilobolus umbonatus]|nr:P-loop containing nucleoside triphosphate hydrolase protein [Pilobolus umbonatus]
MFPKTTIPYHAAISEVSSAGRRNLTLTDIQTDPISTIAKEYFNESAKWNPDVVENIITTELIPSNYSSHKLLLLEFSQYLEKYLWPHFSESSSVHHVFSICLMVNEKFLQKVGPWDAFDTNTEKFSLLFKRVIHLMTDPDQSYFFHRTLLVFLIHCFQSLENSLVRVECLKLVTVGIWSNFAHDSRREQLLREYPPLQKLWNSSQKKLNAADEATREEMEYERNWLSTMLSKFVELVYAISLDDEVDEEALKLCERFAEFFIDLEAQLPTRRFFNSLLDDHEIIVLCQMAPLMKRDNKDVDLLKKLIEILGFYSKFEINDHTGVALTDLEMTEIHCKRLIDLQHIVFRQFRKEITELPLANLGSIETREDILWHLEPLSLDILTRLSTALGIRNEPLNITAEVDAREYIMNTMVNRYEKRISQIKKINNQPLYPDETTLFNDSLIQTQFYSGERPLALPKLNLQFLTIHDYLLRNFTLFRLESSYEIRQDLEDIVKRLSPRLTYPERKTEFGGWARMAVPIDSFNIVSIGQPNLGEDRPSRVLADINYSVKKYSSIVAKEWDNLRKHDVLFLLSIQANEYSADKLRDDEDFREHYGIKYVRGCEVVDIIGSDGRSIDEVQRPTQEDKASKWNGFVRTLRVELDANQYMLDMDRFNHKHSEDVHQTFNVLVRRRPQENNFKSVLETIRDLMQSDLVVPEWLQKVFLGYGDPASAHYTKMPNRVHDFNFRDTFLNWEHLKESFKGKPIQLSSDEVEPLEPPYIVKVLDDPMEEDKPAKKSKKAKKVPKTSEVLEVASYKLPNMGPYPQDKPKLNQVRFTPVQVDSIYSGMNHGLTMVVGPPGTGKTDIAVQTISNLYHNYPDQHTLIVTHSNQALNQIFEKIIQLDIDPRHLVRLGHGEEELNTELSFSKYGRVSSFLEQRIILLAEVTRLSQSLNIVGEHGATCETAGYFYTTHIEPLENAFIRQTADAQTVENIRDAFPFHEFFSNAPNPIFTQNMTAEEGLEVAQGCFRHLNNIFSQLEEIRPFELLRSNYDRANYLLTKEAKIIAMTCTHAALKRRELVGLDFKYDNIIIEEAAQILEVETFIPLLLQETRDGMNRLKRVVLIGDHCQLPPVVKNTAFQQYGNMEQSMFTRFFRLGVPTLQLDKQGRARPSIAKLYNWRYKALEDLDKVCKNEFTKANAGFSYDYQFIHVNKYQGQGETEPVPYFYQNLGEAEYVVAVYQYMRLLGYPPEKISILTTYNGQKALINDVLERRCGWNPYFGKPAVITTVDKYQGQQNDYVLLSLVRTKAVGHLRDVRRLIVAMSRARLGLYVFGFKPLFENCYELKPVFNQFNARPNTLHLQYGETYPTPRDLDNLGDVSDISNVEELGRLVYKLSQEQIQSMRDEVAMMMPVSENE